jgi:hypothetical protein
MVKYARIVFEEDVPDNATPEDALIILLRSIRNASQYLSGEDVEVSDIPYERME